MLKENEILKLNAVDMDFEGNGVCKHEGLVIFVKGMITGEEAIVKITNLKQRFASARIVKLIKTSPFRKNLSNDIDFNSSNLIHLADDYQNEWQKKITVETFKKIADTEIEVNDIISSKRTVYYRNKAVFHVLDKAMFTLGMYNTDNNELVRVDEFILVDKLINKFLHLINNARIIIEKVLKHVVFRTNDKNEILVTLVTEEFEFDGKDELIRIISKEPEVIGITLNLKENEKVILGKNSITVYGKNEIHMSLSDLDIVINDRSFYQINSSICLSLYEKISEEIRKNDIVIDAFSGVGSIGYFIAKKAKKVFLIDNNEENINMANRIKTNNKIDNVEVIEGTVEHKLASIKTDVLIVDPPRNGLMPGTKDAINSNKYQKIIYLSCDVKTLARDYNEIKDNYSILKVIPIRMFPQTTSIETLVVLELK